MSNYIVYIATTGSPFPITVKAAEEPDGESDGGWITIGNSRFRAKRVVAIVAENDQTTSQAKSPASEPVSVDAG